VRVAGPLPALQLTTSTASAWQRQLVPGQVLNAMVVGSTGAGSVLLRVGALELIARTELALAAGQPLLLKVTKGGETPELQVLRGNTEETLITAALRSSLPRQAGLAEQLGRIAATWRQLADPAAAPPALSRAAAALLARPLPSGTEPSALRQALAQSGLFFEARLAQGAFDPADLKGQLLRLLTRLRTPAALSPPAGGAEPEPEPRAAGAAVRGDTLLEALRHHAENALASIRWQQISSLPDDAGRGPVWQLALPLAQPDGGTTNLWLRAQREADGREPGQRRWTLDLSLSLEPLGPLHAHLSLAGEQLSATLWAERDESARLVTEHLAQLGAGLARAGLAVALLGVRAGRPPAPADQPTPPVQGLLDEQA
jgi:hypothetical protein